MVVQKHVRIRRFASLTAAAAALLLASGPAASYAQTAAKPIAASAPADPPANGSDPAPANRIAPPPMVENCAVVTISTPAKYACNGKVYTAYELQHLREKWEAANK